jgi:hypothetical protein
MTRFVQSLLSIALLGGLTACSRSHPPTVPHAADRLIATNRYRESVNITLAGADAVRIAEAVASSTEDPTPYADIKDCEIRFYSGTNLFRVIYVQDRVFSLGATQYSDSSGVVAAFYAKWQTNSFKPAQ